MPQPVLEDGTSDETIAPGRAPEPHDAPAPVTDLEAALRASLRPLASWASKPAARHAMARDLDRDERARCRRIGRTVLA